MRITVPGYGGAKDEQWLHFDAKYRIDSLLEIFGRAEEVENAGDEEAAPGVPVRGANSSGKPVTEDLFKMHAYRDAIRRSSGAFVIYPGDPGSDPELLRQYHEILPGLGAFTLRPSAAGPAGGIAHIRTFIADVLDHAADQASQHERYRYWRAEIFKDGPRTDAAKSQAVSFLSRPPADTRVLLGYVRTAAQYRWIQEVRLYNLRADERRGSVGLHSEELAAELVVLYGPDLERAALWRVTGYPQLLTRERMLNLGYPHPGSTLYFCLPVEPLTEGRELVGRLTFGLAEQLTREIAPFLRSCLLTAGVLPYWGKIRQHESFQPGLQRVNAAVVGLLLAPFYDPVWTKAIRWPLDFGLAAAAFTLLVHWKAPAWLVVVGTQAASQAVYPSPQGIREKGHGFLKRILEPSPPAREAYTLLPELLAIQADRTPLPGSSGLSSTDEDLSSNQPTNLRVFDTVPACLSLTSGPPFLPANGPPSHAPSSDTADE